MLEHHTNHHIVFPEDCNHMGTIFGGKLLSIVDLAVAQHTAILLQNSVCEDAVTVNFNNVNFHCGPVVGDLLIIESTIADIGIKSMRFTFEVIRHKDSARIVSGETTFVSRKNSIVFAHGLPRYKNGKAICL